MTRPWSYTHAALLPFAHPRSLQTFTIGALRCAACSAS
jgi:hypothetical protein